MGKRSGSAVRQDKAVTVKKLREEAAHLFWKKGYAATTTREIAESLGVQKASLYYHIQSKEELLYDLCVESLGNIHAAVARAVEGEMESLERVKAMLRAHVVSMLEDREKHATMLTELKSLSPERRVEIVHLRDEYEGLVQDILSEAQESGALRNDTSSKDLELTLLNLLNWTIFWYNPDGERSPEDLAGMFEKIYLSGVADK